MKLNDQVIKLEENTARLLASKEHAETEFKQVEKSILEERYDFLALLTER